MKILTTTILILLFTATLSAQSWARRYFDNPEDSYSAQSILALPDGNGFILAGAYRPDNLSLRDPLILTLSGDGLMNDLYFPFSSPFREDEIRQIIAAQDGGFILAGDSQNFLDGEPSDHFVAKLDENFELVWKTAFAGIDLDRGNGLMELADGSIITFGGYGKGYTTSTSGGITTVIGLYNGHVAKLAPNGAVIWESVIEDYDQCLFRTGLLLNDGKILLTGEVYDVAAMNTIQLVALFNESGEEAWRKEMATEDYGRALTPLSRTDGTIYLAGRKRSSIAPGMFDEDLTLHEISASGDIIASQQFDLGTQVSIGAVRLGNNGNIFIGGSEFINDTFLTDPFFAEIGLAGSILQKQNTHTENYREFVNDIIVGQNGEIHLLGLAREGFPGTESHAFLIQFSSSVPTREIITNEAPSVRVFPVPASGDVHFSFEDRPLSVPFNLFICDALGRAVHSSMVKDNKHTLERTGLPAGAYYYQIRSGQKLIASGQLYFH